MPMYDWQCPDRHKFETVVSMAKRKGPLPCMFPECKQLAARIEISHTNPGTMLDYGLGLNREALEKGTYDPLKPIQRGVRRYRGEKAGPFG